MRQIGDHFTEPHLDRSALVTIDLQTDFAEGGASPVAGTKAVVPVVRALLDEYRRAARPIVHVIRLYVAGDVDTVRRRQIDEGTPIVRPGSAGAQLLTGLGSPATLQLDASLLLDGRPQRLGPAEWVVWKPRWSAFYRTGLQQHLDSVGADTLIITGCNFPNCPRATVFDATARSYRVVIAEGGVSGLRPSDAAEMERIGAFVVPAPELLACVRQQLPSSRGRHQPARLVR